MACIQQKSESLLPSADYLPNDLWLRILARLPLHQAIQLHCVSKAWRSMLRSPAFLQLHSQYGSSPSASWLVMSRSLPAFLKPPSPPDPNCIAYYLSSGKAGRWSNPLPLDLLNSVTSQSTLSSAAGLICCLKSREHDASYAYTVWVFNPLTRVTRVLPLPPMATSRKCLPSITMVPNSATTGSYHVILFDKHFFENLCYPPYVFDDYLEVYDSRSDCWKVRHAGLIQAGATITVLEGDVFKFDEIEGTLAAYNAVEDGWSEVRVENFHEVVHSGKVLLKTCERRLLLATGLMSCEG